MSSLPALLQFAATLAPGRARLVIEAVCAQNAEPSPETLAALHAQAHAAFAHDMQPLCTALAEAVQSGDLEGLRGLRGLLPHLLEQVLDNETLTDLFALQMGHTLIAGLTASPEGAP